MSLNNKLKAPYSDQFSLGMRNKVGDWNTGATVTRVISHDGFVFTLGNRYPNGDFFQNNSQPWGNGVPGFGSLIIGNNGIETTTTQVLLSAEQALRPRSPAGAPPSPTPTPRPSRTATSTSTTRSTTRRSVIIRSSTPMRCPSIVLSLPA